MIRVGVVGTGDWGRNLVRAFAALEGARLVRVADIDGDRLADVAARHPGVETSTDPASVTLAGDVDAVVVASSAATHHGLAAAALDRGAAVLVEKPLALTAADAVDLVERARRRGAVLMTGHLLLYHPAVEHVEAMVRAGELGELRSMSAVRVNLGRIRADENALWSLAPHDVSVMCRLAGGPPASVSAMGTAWIRPGVEDEAFVTMRWASGLLGHVHVSWLDPQKERRLVVVGTRRRVVFDDMQPAEKLRVTERALPPTAEHVGPGEAAAVRYGPVVIPRVDPEEPLARECRHFLECVRTGARPRSDGEEGLAVVRVLEAASRSLAAGGAPEPVEAGAAQAAAGGGPGGHRGRGRSA